MKRKIDEALAFIEDRAGRFDVAWLDVNLDGAYPIADFLAASAGLSGETGAVVFS